MSMFGKGAPAPQLSTRQASLLIVALPSLACEALTQRGSRGTSWDLASGSFQPLLRMRHSIFSVSRLAMLCPSKVSFLIWSMLAAEITVPAGTSAAATKDETLPVAAMRPAVRVWRREKRNAFMGSSPMGDQNR
ncbi:hypothetical protein D3C85_532720 [compost metagenome]